VIGLPTHKAHYKPTTPSPGPLWLIKNKDMFDYYHIDTLTKADGSFWIDLAKTVIGTSLGFLGAFYLTNRTNKKQKEKDRTNKISRYKERLHYLAELIESVIKILNDQIDNYEELGNSINKEPLEYHLLKIKASSDLQRLQNMDTEEVFHAYHLIIPDSPDKEKNYKNIYGSIDFLYMRNKQAIDSNDNHIKFVYRDQLYIKEAIESLTNEMYNHIKLIETKEKGFESLPKYVFLRSHHKNYMGLSNSKVKLSELEMKFLLPFGDELRQTYSQEAFFGDLNTLVTKALIKFNHIRDNSLKFSSELLGIRKEMKSAIEKLTNIKENITSHNTA
jgi:hypothetical protein